MSRVAESDWRRLASAVTGRVLLPGQPGYRGVSGPFNKRFAGTRPLGVVSVESVADVSRAIEWARDHGMHAVVRGGGHSYAGYSVGTGLVIDLSALNSVSVEGSSGLVTVGGAARMADICTAIQPYEMAFALGNGDSVGIGGLTLGGGSAATSRKFGLTADALVRTTVVTADCRVVTCDVEQNADLFWACRGGGGGNFGINVSFTFQARPVSNVSTCLVLWDRSDAATVLPILQEISLKAPDEFSVRIGVSTSNASGTMVSAVGQHLGPATELREILAPVLALARPLREDIADRSFWEAIDYLHHETSGGAFAARTNFARQPLPAEALATVLSMIDRWPGSTNPDGGGIALFGWGGAINRVAPTDTAFAHRDAQYLVALDTSWTGDDPPTLIDANLRWLSDLHDAITPYVSEAAYQNFIDPDLPNWRSAYYGVNYQRLVEVKRRFDPNGFFTFAQSIDSTSDASSTTITPALPTAV